MVIDFLRYLPSFLHTSRPAIALGNTLGLQVKRRFMYCGTYLSLTVTTRLLRHPRAQPISGFEGTLRHTNQNEPVHNKVSGFVVMSSFSFMSALNEEDLYIIENLTLLPTCKRH